MLAVAFSPTLKRQAVYIGRRYATCKCHSAHERRSHDRFMSNGFQPVAEMGGCNAGFNTLRI